MPLTSPPIPTRLNGQIIDQTWFNLLKTILEQFEGRFQEIEGSINPILFSVFGEYSDPSLVGDQRLITRLNFDITVLDVKLLIHTAGSAGSTTVDIEYKRGGGPWTSILTALPTLAFGAGDFAENSGVVNGLEQDLLAGDLLRMNVDAVQTGGRGFQVFIDYEATV